MKKLSRVLVLLLAVSLLCAQVIVPTYAEPVESDVILEAEDITCPIGKETTMALKMTKNEGVIVLAINATIDEDLEYLGVRDAELLGGYSPLDSLENHRLQWADGGAKVDYTDTGDLAYLSFRVPATAKVGDKFEVSFMLYDGANNGRDLVLDKTAVFKGSITAVDASTPNYARACELGLEFDDGEATVNGYYGYSKDVIIAEQYCNPEDGKFYPVCYLGTKFEVSQNDGTVDAEDNDKALDNLESIVVPSGVVELEKQTFRFDAPSFTKLIFKAQEEMTIPYNTSANKSCIYPDSYSEDFQIYGFEASAIGEGKYADYFVALDVEEGEEGVIASDVVALGNKTALGVNVDATMFELGAYDAPVLEYVNPETGDTETVEEFTVVNKGGKDFFQFTANVAPQYMGQDITMTIKADDAVIGEFTGSVQAYLTNRLSEVEADSAEEKLCVATLAYGEKAQAYYGQPDTGIAAIIAPYGYDLPTTTPAGVLSTTGSGSCAIMGINLASAADLGVRLFVDGSNLADMKLKVTNTETNEVAYGKYTGTQTVVMNDAESTAATSLNLGTFVFDKINPADFETAFTFVIVDGEDAEVSNAVTYSLASYTDHFWNVNYKVAVDSSTFIVDDDNLVENFHALLQALVGYCNAAVDYLA